MIKTSPNTPRDVIPLMPNHHWYVRRDMVNPAQLLDSKLLRLPKDFDLQFLHVVMNAWYQRHGALRLRLSKTLDDYCVSFAPLEESLVEHSIIHIDVKDARSFREQLSSQGTLIKSNFDVASGPLLKAVFFDSEVHSQRRLLLIAHQLVVDEYSWRTLLYELAVIYKKYQAGQKLPQQNHNVVSKKLAIARYAEFLSQQVKKPELLDEKPFWLEQLSATLPSLPQDWPTPNYGLQRDAKFVKFELDSEATAKLLARSSRAYRTKPPELLLTALALSFFDWCGTSKMRVDLHDHGRNSQWCGINLAKTVGWFSCSFPLFLNLDSCALDKDSHSDIRLGAAVKSIKEQYRGLPNNGIGYSVLRYLAVDAQMISLAAKNRAEVSFEFIDHQQWRDAKEGSLSQSLFPLSYGDSGADIDGDKVRDHGLRFVALLIDGRLRFELEYDPNAYNKVSMERLSLCYQMALKALIVHCCDPQNGSFTPSDFALAKDLTQRDIDKWQHQYRDLQQIYPMSPMQASYFNRRGPMFNSNVSQICLDLKGWLDTEKVESLWQQVINEQSILRTVFVDIGSKAAKQLVMTWAQWKWNEQDWRYLAPITQQHQFVRWYEKDRSRNFDLTKPPLMRVTVFRLADSHFRCLLSFHHGMLDRPSVNLLLKQMFSRYVGKEDAIEFVDETQLFSWCIEQDNYQAIRYWRHQLIASPHVSKLAQATEPTSVYECFHYDFELQMAREFERFEVPIGVFAQGVWAAVLAKFSEQQQVTFAQSCSIRHLLPFEQESNQLSQSFPYLGRYSHVLPVVIAVNENKAVVEWLHDLYEAEKLRCFHAHLSISDLIKSTGISISSVFSSQVVIEEDLFEPLQAIVSGEGEANGGEKQIELQELTACKPFCSPLVFVMSHTPLFSAKIYYDKALVSEDLAKSFLDDCRQTIMAFVDKLNS